MNRKTFDLIETKADGDSGVFTALVSVFDNVDLVGDRIKPGAFSKSLEKMREAGDPLPIILSHQHDDVMAHIGKADPADVVETAKGLQVTGQLDIEDNPVAKQTFKLLKERRLKEFSFGYMVPKGGQKRAKDGANDISEVDIFEAGPTLKGANPATELQAVKAMMDSTGEEAADLIDGMVVLAQSFIDSEPDPADVAVMQDILDRLNSLNDSEAAEGEASLSPDAKSSKKEGNTEIEDRKDEEPPAKSERQDPLRKIKNDLARARLGR